VFKKGTLGDLRDQVAALQFKQTGGLQQVTFLHPLEGRLWLVTVYKQTIYKRCDWSVWYLRANIIPKLVPSSFRLEIECTSFNRHSVLVTCIQCIQLYCS